MKQIPGCEDANNKDEGDWWRWTPKQQLTDMDIMAIVNDEHHEDDGNDEECNDEDYWQKFPTHKL